MKIDQLVPAEGNLSARDCEVESTVREAGLPSRRPWAILLASAVLLGFALRLYHLDSQSVWYDEVFALSVSRLPFAQMHEALVQDLVHPPLHYYALHWWFQAFGFGPFQGRLLSVLFGTFAIVLIYALASYLFDRRAALLAAVLLAISQLSITYSQEARPYAQFLLLYLGSAYLLFRALREKRVRVWIGFFCVACLLIYTHYYGFLALASFLLFAFIRREQYSLSRAWLWGGICGVALVYVPWLSSGIVSQVLHGEKIQKLNTMAHLLAPVHWYTLATIVNGFNNGRPNGLLVSCPVWTFIVGSVLFCFPAALALLPLAGPQKRMDEREEREHLTYLLFLFVVPIILALALGFLYGTYDVKYVAFCAAPYYILVARGLTVGNSSVLRWGFVLAILAYSAFCLRANYFIPYKEDYKDAFAAIVGDDRPGDCAVVAPPWEERQARWAWSIYQHDRPSPRVISLDAVASAGGECQRVWLISIFDKNTPPAVKQSELARRVLAQVYVESWRKRFFWVDVDLYAPAREKLQARSGIVAP